MMEAIVDSETLQNIDTHETARQYIDAVIAISSPFDVLRYMQSFFLPTHQHRRRNRSVAKQRGGTDSNKVYNLLALCDSVHDASRVRVSVDTIMKVMRMTDADLPKGLTREELKDEKRVVDFLQRRKTLRFGDGCVVANPTYKAELRLSDIPNADDIVTEDIAAALHRRMRDKSSGGRVLGVSVFADYTGLPKHKRLQFRQVLCLAYQMRSWFGPSCVFQPDALHPLVKFVTATHLIGDEFYKKFVVDQQYSVAKYAAEIRAIVDQAAAGSRTTWELELSDANIYDAQSTDERIAVDPRPTGCVYRPDFGVQVCLRPLPDRMAEVVYAGRNGASTTEIVDSSSARLLSSTEVVFSSVKKASEDAELQLALKRAGDWGQVEHCVKYDRVFVTSDVLAALYAYFRGVRFMLLLVQKTPKYEHYFSILGRSC
jgi:hypothetical protein